jgi:hypothetical protein
MAKKKERMFCWLLNAFVGNYKLNQHKLTILLSESELQNLLVCGDKVQEKSDGVHLLRGHVGRLSLISHRSVLHQLEGGYGRNILLQISPRLTRTLTRSSYKRTRYHRELLLHEVGQSYDATVKKKGIVWHWVIEFELFESSLLKFTEIEEALSEKIHPFCPYTLTGEGHEVHTGI